MLRDTVEAMCFFGGVIIVCFTLAAGPVIYFGQRSCNNYKEMTGKNTEYKYFDSCYVETENGWQKWDEYLAKQTANGLIDK